MKPKVVIFGTFSADALGYYRKQFTEGGCEVITGKSFLPDLRQTQYPPDELKELIADADVVLTAGSKALFNEAALTPTPPRLRGIVTSSLGYNAIDVKACTERAIIVSNSPVDTNYEGVLQHTVLLALTHLRRLHYFQQYARDEKDWSPFGSVTLPALIDAKTTVGIIGFGRIGYRVARIFRLFGAHVLVYDPYVMEDRAKEIGAEVCESMDDLLRRSDVVSTHTFLSDETANLIGARELSLMKPTAVLINTSRGGIVDEAALTVALQKKQIGGAALDVTALEPMAKDNPLLAMDNVIITPHIAGGSIQHAKVATEFAANSVLSLVNGQLPKMVVNATAIPAWAERFKASGIRYGGTVYYRA